MCAVSQVGDYATREWEGWIYRPSTSSPSTGPNPFLTPIVVKPPTEVSREEFDTLKKKVEELHTLLLAAKKYDEVTDQPHCEVDDKVAVIKKIAEYFGVDMKDVFE
jgi:hypothetical protein